MFRIVLQVNFFASIATAGTGIMMDILIQQ